MINPERKIVFVIGAGASADFGFPVGQTIATVIQQRLDQEFREGAHTQAEGPIRAALGNGALKSEYIKASQQLRAGIGPGETIDQFLFRRRNSRHVRDLGLMTLAHVILEAERESPLMNFSIENYENSLNALRSTSNSWPAVLLDQLVGIRSPDEITPELFKDVAFVIFNYDRCVQQTLFHHLYRRHDLSPSDALEIVKAIPTIHVYGVLGDFDGSIPFGAKNAPLGEISGRLRTYHEGVIDKDHGNKIRTLIDGAEKIVFLGFGFHSTNVSLLFGGEDLLPDARLLGTRLHCSTSAPLKWILNAPGSYFEESNCTGFLRGRAWGIIQEPWDV